MKFSLKFSSFSKALAYTFLGFMVSLTIGGTYAAWNSVKQSGDTLTSADWNDLVSQIGAWNRASSAADSNVSLGTTGNVGIGTTSPGNKLTIYDGAVSAVMDPTLKNRVGYTASNDLNNYIQVESRASNATSTLLGQVLANWGYIRTAGLSGLMVMTGNAYPILFGTDNVERMRITGTGNVGIGTTSPATRLHASLDTDTSNTQVLTAENSGTTNAHQPALVAKGKLPGIGFYETDVSDQNWMIRGDTGNLNFGTNNNAFSSFASKVTLLNNGNVGIGTTSPSQKLHVTADENTDRIVGLFENANTGSNSVATLRLLNNRAGQGAYADLKVINPTGSNDSVLAFYTQKNLVGTTERMRIDNNGNVGIGTTSPGAKLHVISGTNTTNTYPYSPNLIIESPTGSSQMPIEFRLGGTTKGHMKSDVNGNLYLAGTGTGRVSLGNQSSEQLTVLSSGDVGIGTITPSYKLHVNGTAAGASWTNTSDKRLKKNIQPIVSALNKVEKLQGVNFEWRKDEFKDRNFPEGKQMGFIAQEVEKVLPELVTTDNEGYKGVEYANITAVLVEAIKEQQKEIESLRTEIENLKK